MNHRRKRILSLLASTVAIAPMSAAFAQDISPPTGAAEAGDIIVTARKREETSIAVPVSIVAIGGAELNQRGVSNFDSLAHLVPGLNIADGGGTIQGGTVTLRGIAGPDTNPLGDQAVSFNIDNVAIARSSVRRLGNFDVAQIEVLKGPQTLFFGKNSPGGVVTLRTNDPTDHLEAKISAGYETEAREWRTEGYLSGPLSDTLAARVAWYTSDLGGWVKNLASTQAPVGSIIYPAESRGPESHEWDVRGTLVWNPSDRFNARLKYTYGKGHGSEPAYNFQYIFCPYGAPQFAGVIDNCKADDLTNHAGFSPLYKDVDPRFTDKPYSRQNSQLASLELNYDIDDQLRLTSVSGFYKFRYALAAQVNTGVSTERLPFFGLPSLPSVGGYSDKELSQELRLASDFDGPFNFTIGGIYSDTKTATDAHTLANPEAPIEFNQYHFYQSGKAYSFFAQLSYKITPAVELSGGGRYSHEEKTLDKVLQDLTGSPANGEVEAFPPVNHISKNDFSPEVTLSYRPSSDLTLYASYKRGFLSGGFNGSSADFNVTPDLSYGPQKVRGFEGGVKAALLDRALRLNFAIFTYDVLGLQITSFANTVGTIRNAGKVRVKGAEFDFNYRTQIEGLSLHGGAAYLDGTYKDYLAPCYAGQAAAMGCSGVNNGSPVQDLSGTPLRNAPKWNVSGGFYFDQSIGAGLKIGLGADVNYSSAQITDAKSTPHALSPAQALVDASLRLGSEDDVWELALIGQNLTDKYYWSNSQEVPLTGNGFVKGNPLADLWAVPSRGRQIMLRATLKFGG